MSSTPPEPERPGPAFLSEDEAVDLHTCDREPIHLPGSIQPYGFLLVLRSPDLHVVQVSDNVQALTGTRPEETLGRPLQALLGESLAARLRRWSRDAAARGSLPFSASVRLGQPARRYDVVAHRNEGGILLELEPTVEADASVLDTSPLLEGTIERLKAARSTQELYDIAVREVRRLTGLDRVKMYVFDEQLHGNVIAEDRAEHMPSYLGLRFPSTDVPRQAHRLYVVNRTRLIADVDYTPSRLVPVTNPLTGGPLDLTHSLLRSVSPIHIEYLHNMGVKASMSISVVHEDRLLALIAGHHATPRHISFQVRSACALLGQVLALLVLSQEEVEDRAEKLRRKEIQTRLLEGMIQKDKFVEALVERQQDLLDLVGADGAVIYAHGRSILLGKTPEEPDVPPLIGALEQRLQAEGLYATDCLTGTYPPAAAFQAVASGVLAVALSRLRHYYVLWFRSELLQTVRWAGEPEKAVRVDADGSLRVHPRRSFEVWREVQRGHALPWKQADLDAARELRAAIIDVVFVRAEQIRELNASLRRSNRQLRHWNRELQHFATMASHDLKEPLRKLQTFSGLLKDEYAGQLDAQGQGYLERICSAAERMSKLLGDLLSFSKEMTETAPFERTDLGRVARDVIADLKPIIEDTGGRVEVEPLPEIEANPGQMHRLLFHLLLNALKFRAPDRPPVISLRAELERIEPFAAPEERDLHQVCCLVVEDNGIGFDEKFAERIFNPFQRLNPRAEFEGTGIGLAICRHIVERHGGAISAHSVPDQGSRFTVELPVRQRAVEPPEEEA